MHIYNIAEKFIFFSVLGMRGSRGEREAKGSKVTDHCSLFFFLRAGIGQTHS